MPDIAWDNQTGSLVSAHAGIKKRNYTCVCPSKHPVYLRQGKERVAHFSHFPVQSQETVDILPSCRNGGESEIHIKAKHKLVICKGEYKFAIKTCVICREKLMEDCHDGELEMEIQSSDKRWRYDVLLTRSDQTQLALEVCHTHATGDDKCESSSQLGVPIVEFDAQEILDLQPGGVLRNLRCASWICSQSCLDHKNVQEEQRQLRKKLEDEKKQSRMSARMLEEKKKSTEKLYFHCDFNGLNYTHYWAPLKEGVITYGKLYGAKQ